MVCWGQIKLQRAKKSLHFNTFHFWRGHDMLQQAHSYSCGAELKFRENVKTWNVTTRPRWVVVKWWSQSRVAIRGPLPLCNHRPSFSHVTSDMLHMYVCKELWIFDEYTQFEAKCCWYVCCQGYVVIRETTCTQWKTALNVWCKYWWHW